MTMAIPVLNSPGRANANEGGDRAYSMPPASNSVRIAVLTTLDRVTLSFCSTDARTRSTAGRGSCAWHHVNPEVRRRPRGIRNRYASHSAAHRYDNLVRATESREVC